MSLEGAYEIAVCVLFESEMLPRGSVCRSTDDDLTRETSTVEINQA